MLVQHEGNDSDHSKDGGNTAYDAPTITPTFLFRVLGDGKLVEVQSAIIVLLGTLREGHRNIIIKRTARLHELQS